jgi:two-component system, NarL family, sensor kinase
MTLAHPPRDRPQAADDHEATARGGGPPAAPRRRLRWRPRVRLSPVMQFALSGLAVLALVGLLGVRLFQHAGDKEAIRNAMALTRVAGRGIIVPATTPGLLRGSPAALAAMDRAVRAGVLHDPVVRVKIWDASGRIIYSDARALIGHRYPLEAAELHALRTGGVKADISDLTRPENRLDRRYHKLLEVYQGIIAAGGQRLLFESYERYSSITDSSRRLWLAFAPALIVALVLLELVQVPLAMSLVRRLRRGQREREGLLHRSVQASARERRRIARDLHDGPVQNLAGVSFTLAAASEELRGGREAPDVASALDEAAKGARSSIRQLRTLLVDLYPQTLHREGLEPALTDLVAPLRAAGLKTTVSVSPALRLDDQVEATIFRVAQEAVRNVAGHADAGSIRVDVGQEQGTVVLIVSDDGRGFDVARMSASARDHFGLRVMTDLVEDAGGSLELYARPGEGTRLEARVPLGRSPATT